MALQFDISEITNILEDIASNVSNKITEEALMKGAEIMLEEQKVQVPKDTGALENSLGIFKPTGKNANKKVKIGIKNDVADEVVYGYYQEYGTKNMAGKKWMQKSFQNSIEKANEQIKETIKEQLLK